ncbi:MULTISPECIES: hypothetical protein [unclassified Meridianimarinicoccus]|uniref:hypothetical protein n=1 Tax=unclassified Meridianimarinicoccus TaxID=2923344 RepID=UPI0018675813|nr:hypothetical protein [Fluviibacterium sp. MJW13]
MFDSQSSDSTQRPLKAVPISQLARQGRWEIDTPRSYLVPVLLWFTCGQGRLSIGGEVRGYTAHNAIFLPANTSHACQALGRTQGTALFMGGRKDLPVPQEVLHLRLSTLQDQAELNQLVEGFRADCRSTLPLTDEVLHHRASLISLWLTRKHLMSGTRRITHQPEMPIARRSAAD